MRCRRASEGRRRSPGPCRGPRRCSSPPPPRGSARRTRSGRCVGGAPRLQAGALCPFTLQLSVLWCTPLPLPQPPPALALIPPEQSTPLRLLLLLLQPLKRRHRHPGCGARRRCVVARAQRRLAGPRPGQGTPGARPTRSGQGAQRSGRPSTGASGPLRASRGPPATSPSSHCKKRTSGPSPAWRRSKRRIKSRSGTARERQC